MHRTESSSKTGRQIWNVETWYFIIAFQTIDLLTLFKLLQCSIKSMFQSVFIWMVNIGPVKEYPKSFSKPKLEFYKIYTDFYPWYAGQRHVLFDYIAFELHRWFIIDYSRRQNKLKSLTVHIKLDTKIHFRINTSSLSHYFHCFMQYLQFDECKFAILAMAL